MKTYFRCAFREFRHRKGRVAVNIAGYAIAISIVLSLYVWLDFARLSTEKVLKEVGAHFIGYMPDTEPAGEKITKDPMEGFVAAGVHSMLFPVTLVEKIAGLPSVKDASPALCYRVRSDKDGHLFIIEGFDPSHKVSIGSTTCAPADILKGRFIGMEDRGLVMVEDDYASSRKIDVGDIITIGRHRLQVAGIINPAVRPAKADVYMHIEDARTIISDRVKPGKFPPDTVNIVLVEAKNGRTMDAAMTGMGSIDTRFRVYGFACWRPATKAMGMSEKAVEFLLVVLLIGVFLFAGKTQFASVVEREHDIGILKVVGWSRRNIIMQVLTESVILSLAGSLLGFIISGLVVYLVPVKTVTDFPLTTGVIISPVLLLWVLFLSIAGGILAGLLPSISAARRTPAESLRRL
ncbi:MAG TPA: ABC transporter permease [bacterium]|mgnify:CR=1 FL=1|nr:ABC transporter permease [bacterium]HPP29995.1 ABC transporter permease [bacterium]